MKYSTKALSIKLRPDNIIEIRENPDWDKPDTLEVAKENVAGMVKAMGGQKRAILSYSPHTHIDKKVLEYYSNTSTQIGAIATAMISRSFGSKLMGNVFLKIPNKANPIRIFSEKEEDKAVEWLLKCIEKANN